MYQHRFGDDWPESINGPGRHQVECQLAMYFCGKKGQQHPGLHYEKCFQQVKSGDPPSLLSSGETISGVLCPDLGSPLQERDGHPWAIPVKDYKDV